MGCGASSDGAPPPGEKKTVGYAGEDLTKYNEAREKAEEAEKAAELGALRSGMRRPSMATIAVFKVVRAVAQPADDPYTLTAKGAPRVCHFIIHALDPQR